jgi:dTDP-4-dehydrorhamnose 3,5-epimerase
MQAETLTIIQGGRHADKRGVIGFANAFDMKEVRRFYRVFNNEEHLKRGWRAHKIEQRWFCVLSGSFKVSVIEIDNWESPSKTLKAQSYHLVNDNTILHVPRGYATCLEALEPGSEIMLFADSLIEDASKDDYLFPLNYFDN